MSEQSVPHSAARPLPIRALLAAALAAALGFTLIGWLQASPFSVDPVTGTDDMVRLLRVRDLIGGQSWFDQTLHRLGTGDGTPMHWSRLIDAPIAAILLAGDAAGLNGERLAAIAWPLFTFAAAMAGFLAGVQRASGSRDLLPAIVIGGFALAASGTFDAGSLDHHNAQLALMIWLIALLTPGGRDRRSLAAAGVLTALMLAIGMEALPLAVAGALTVFLRLQSQGDGLVPAVRSYGLGLATTLAALFVLLTPASAHAAAACDAFSLFHLAAGGTGGLALWLLLSQPAMNILPKPRLLAPLLAGAAALAVTAVWFPGCLADPIAQLDPDLRRFWIDQVVETQNVFQIARLDPWLLPALHALPLLALVFGLRDCRRNGLRAPVLAALVFVGLSSLVTLYQMRGSQFAIPAAAMTLAMLVTSFGAGAGRDSPVKRLAALALSTTVVWKLLILAGIGAFSGGQTGPLINGAGAAVNGGCRDEAALASLNAQPPGFVAAANSIGPAILYATPHRVLAGPYHRNVDGNLAWIHAMTGDPLEAADIFNREGITLLAFCPSDPDEISFQAAAPNGLAGQLMAGKTPSFLAPAAETMDKPLRIYRIIR